MINQNLIPIDIVIERLYTNSAIIKKLQLNKFSIVELIIEGLNLIGAGPYFSDQYAVVEIEDYRGTLPCMPRKILALRDVIGGIRESTNTFATSPNRLNTHHDDITNDKAEYKIEGNVIFMQNMKQGAVEVKYSAYHTDERGFPLINDEERLLKALEAYVRFQIYLPMWEIGDIRDAVFARAEQEWLFYVNSAKTKALMPDRDGMEALKNNVVTLIRDFSPHDDNFRGLGISEQRLNRRGIR
jgi:hypothetical protein